VRCGDRLTRAGGDGGHPPQWTGQRHVIAHVPTQGHRLDQERRRLVHTAGADLDDAEFAQRHAEPPTAAWRPQERTCLRETCDRRRLIPRPIGNHTLKTERSSDVQTGVRHGREEDTRDPLRFLKRRHRPGKLPLLHRRDTQ
jgi:hypothetical protein